MICEQTGGLDANEVDWSDCSVLTETAMQFAKEFAKNNVLHERRHAYYFKRFQKNIKNNDLMVDP
ncbi:MAG: hypothetical protein CMG89_18005 [Marinobacter sp.]|mgnify:CR=1|nr:hypothetical protein [Marinobacter sp.]